MGVRTRGKVYHFRGIIAYVTKEVCDKDKTSIVPQLYHSKYYYSRDKPYICMYKFKVNFDPAEQNSYCTRVEQYSISTLSDHEGKIPVFMDDLDDQNPIYKQDVKLGSGNLVYGD